eukprot:TRINITY_DN11001_c0_g2_i2.p1 TRINITY_DN11001_c0_g2~~TRINITY_DN11001_c0_g2_i2.p1  ORF type:complete len:493 (+),score=163.32 TRINITY_DN11001_c0_g2_i2:27-1505(+)
MGDHTLMALFSACLLLAGAAGEAQPPHLIVALVDDLGSYNVPWKNPEQGGAGLKAFVESEAVLLERFYTYKYCSPTRASLMSGRFPVHVNEKNPQSIDDPVGGVDLKMTFLPQKLKAKGYATAMIGKGHLGARSWPYLPKNRGFDYHFGFLTGGEDHNTQIGYEAGHKVDLWQNDSPAYGRNGTNSCPLYAQDTVRFIDEHDPATPLFMYLPFHDVHAPYESLPQYTNSTIPVQRRAINGMMTCVAEATMNITNALKAKGMWDNTLMVWASDNGGPSYDNLQGNNYPLRGGKTTDYEGGVRVAAFAAGGLVPPRLRGVAIDAPMHVADVHTTFCLMAGLPWAEIEDTVAGLPGVDGVDVRSLLNGTGSPPEDREIVLSSDAFMQGQYKYVRSTTTHGFWTGPDWPNPTRAGSTPDLEECADGCLFDVVADPSEHRDLSAAMPDRFAAMKARMIVITKGAFQTNATHGYDTCVTINHFAAKHRGFAGPLCIKA